MSQRIKILLTAIILFSSFKCITAQSIIGPTPVYINTTQVYTYTTSVVLNSPEWFIVKGQVIDDTQVGNTYSVTVLWTATGTGSVTLKQLDEDRGPGYITVKAKSVTINPCTISQPSVTHGSRCGTGSVTLTASVGSGGTDIKWYSSSSGGTSIYTGTSYATGSLSAPSTSYYATSYNSTTGCESSPRTEVIASVNPLPSPPTPTHADRCGTGSVQLGANGSNVNWYETNGTYLTTSTSYVTPSIDNTTAYHITNVNPSTGCESSPRTVVTATVNSLPQAPTPFDGSRCASGTVQLSASSGAGGTSVKWYTTSGTYLTSSTNYQTPSIDFTTTYHITSFNSSPGCESSPPTIITAVVTPLPSPPATSTNGDVVSNTGGQAQVSVSAVVGATSYAWYTQGSGGAPIAGQTSTTYSPTISQNTTYYVESLTGTCASATRKSVVATIHPEPQISANNNAAISMGVPVVLSVNNYSYDSYTWLDASGNPIAGAPTTSSFSATQQGTYKVRVTKGSSSVFVLPTGKIVTKGTEGVNLNYVVSNTILVDNITDPSPSVVDYLTVESNNQNIQYYDGLGRPIQSLVTQGSPAKKDIVQPVVYDALGRNSVNYLPFVGGINGWFKTDFMAKENPNYTTVSSQQYQFYQNTPQVASDTKPYAETVFEASPLNRPLKDYGPGQSWSSTGSNKFVEKQYSTNVHSTSASPTSEKVIAWKLDGTGMPVRISPLVNYIVTGGYYSSGQLFVNVSIDEQRNSVREYTNKNGQVILKKVQVAGSTDLNNTSQWALTYYVYDDVGNLRYVFPPELSKKLHSNIDSYVVTPSDVSTWAFQYKYDGRKRMIEKQVPGASAVYMVYDKRDRLVMTQDGKQRAANQWLYNKYDVLNRPIITGIYTHGSSIDQPGMSALISTTNLFETVNDVAATHGYTNNVFPTTGTVLTVTYYDNYSFKTMVSGLTYVTNDYTGQPSTEFLQVAGLVTGTKVNILGSSTYLYGVTYYDDKYRVLQTITQNHKTGTDRATNKYDFPGRIVETKRTYVVSGVTRTVKETFTYDHASRLSTVKHSTNGAADVIIVENKYNELGNLIDKQLHSTDNGTTFKQSIDFRYNIRGWLTKINESDVSTLASGETLGDYFGMELGYNNSVSGITSTTVFNGNISAMKWSTGVVGAANLQGNAFEYDSLNRLKNTSHYKDGFVGWANDNSYLETGFKYDLNGNIRSLTRRGDASEIIDNLTYFYSGNQLSYVNDAGNPIKGFINGNTGTDDYAYDVNGNLIKDKNKGIVNNNDIKYNHLNLPNEVVKGADKVKYYYDATGRKLYQELYTGASVTKTTDYVGELIFENNTLQFINTSEGRVLPDGANWEYQYHMKDHLGNVRLTFTAKTPVAIEHTATFESGTQTTEQATFNNYSSITFDLVDHTDAGTTFQKVQSLNGGATGRVGLAKSYSVMPGDKIKAEVYAKYRNLTASANGTAFITALASAFGTSSGATGELGKIYSGLNNYASAVVGGDHYGDDEGAPKAFVNIILFDKNYNLVDAAWDQIDVAANQVSGTVKTPPNHDYMWKEITVSEPGYAYVFLSNEHPFFVDVYYDDFKVTHTPSPVVGVNDYYPFGLTFNSYSRENSLVNQYLYNGKEKQDELDLGWSDFGARMYMPEIARWGVVDKMGEKYYSFNPYMYAANNPLSFIDPDGEDLVKIGVPSEGGIKYITVDSKIARQAYDFAWQMYAQYGAYVTESYRTDNEQANQKGVGTSLVAKVGESRHQQGFALDIGVNGAFYKKNKMNATDAEKKEVGDYGKSLGWGWQYELKDYPHFELDPLDYGYTSRKEAYETNKKFFDEIGGYDKIPTLDMSASNEEILGHANYFKEFWTNAISELSSGLSVTPDKLIGSGNYTPDNYENYYNDLVNQINFAIKQRKRHEAVAEAFD